MKKTILLLISILLLPFPALAHAGHNHSDGLHQTIAVIVILSSIVIIYTGVRYFNKKKKEKVD
ncbi:MAG: hypothetical protein Q8P20_08565 [bacterium]|nr:hypothetical protein [bacterium]